MTDPAPERGASSPHPASQPIAGLGCSRNLVVVKAGRDALHEGWLGGRNDGGQGRDFDLLVAAYDPDVEAPDHPGTAYLWAPGSKIAGYADIFRRHPELLDRYDYIALFDDDLIASRSDIERLFQIGREYALDLFQPALSWDSHFSYAATLAMSAYRLRYTNTVEMMCPVFSAAYLRRALPLFSLGYETGIDLIWTRIADAPWFRYAIVDCVVFKHTRPIGTTKVAHGFGADERYDTQAAEVLDRAGASFRGFVCYAAIDRAGNRVGSRTAIALRSIGTFAAWRTTPVRRPLFARLATDFTRHCLWRPVNMSRIDESRLSARRREAVAHTRVTEQTA
ncbi:MAG: DUF707 domain-containing protein [Hyphomicrobium sp.]|jgi:hypothetical protein